MGGAVPGGAGAVAVRSHPHLHFLLARTLVHKDIPKIYRDSLWTFIIKN